MSYGREAHIFPQACKAVLICGGLLLAVTAQAIEGGQNTNQSGSQSTNQGANQSNTVPPASNAVTQAAVQQGVFACAGRINQVSNFLGFNAQAGALLMPPPAQPDQRLVPLSMEVATANGPAYVAVTFAPNQANGCGAAYDAVAYWSLSCELVASQQFSALKKSGALKKDILVFSSGVASNIFLMPAGSGCVSIKKEVVL